LKVYCGQDRDGSSDAAANFPSVNAGLWPKKVSGTALAPVRIPKAERGEHLPLPILHDLGGRLLLVIVTDQVQGAVHDEVREMCGQGLALLGRLALDDGGADHEVAEGQRLRSVGRQ